MIVTDGLPIAYWEFDADDPYPAWFAHHATLFKMFPPAGGPAHSWMPLCRAGPAHRHAALPHSRQI